MIAAIYARKSTEQIGVSDEEKSVTRQIEHAKAYALRKGWTIAAISREIGKQFHREKRRKVPVAEFLQ
jgi:DNA invertase Pin-like site-specific DNA recombinase